MQFLTPENEVVRAVYIKGSFLTERDIEGMDIDPRNSMYYANPEDALIRMEEEMYLEENLDEAIRKLESEQKA